MIHSLLNEHTWLDMYQQASHWRRAGIILLVIKEPVINGLVINVLPGTNNTLMFYKGGASQNWQSIMNHDVGRWSCECKYIVRFIFYFDWNSLSVLD